MVSSLKSKAGLVTAIVAAFLLGELSLVSDASAHPKAPAEGQPRWSELDEQPVMVARRRRRRSRRRKRRSTPPPSKSKKKKNGDSSAGPAPESGGGGGAAPASGELRRGARVEFDGRLVQGQTAKSGAIYLFARKRSELRSMVKERENYRKEILRTVYPKYDK